MSSAATPPKLRVGTWNLMKFSDEVWQRLNQHDRLAAINAIVEKVRECHIMGMQEVPAGSTEWLKAVLAVLNVHSDTNDPAGSPWRGGITAHIDIDRQECQRFRVG